MFLVFCQDVTPRVEYVFRHVFTHVFEIEISFTNVLDTFVAHNGPKMSYGKQPLGNEFFVEAVPLLFEQGIQEIDIQIQQKEGRPYFFAVGKKSTFPFDVFAAIFYLLSRYEEYLPHVTDAYDRFTAQQSLAYREKFLEMPLVDFWLKDFYSSLISAFPELNTPSEGQVRFMPLMEIDSPYKYKNKSFFMNFYQWLKSMKELDLWSLVEMPLVLLNLRKDPWDIFSFYIDEFQKKAFSTRFFFLYSKASYLDRGVSPFNSAFKSLIKGVADYFPVSLLVSYTGQRSSSIFKKEKEGLSLLIHRALSSTRFAWDADLSTSSYRHLITQEIHHDFSMGYSHALGYRASTAIPFSLFDLANETKTEVVLYPFVASYKVFDVHHPLKTIKKLNDLNASLPLSKGIHSVVLTNKIFENSEENQNLRSAIIAYLQGHD